jgi:hypothetical protein
MEKGQDFRAALGNAYRDGSVTQLRWGISATGSFAATQRPTEGDILAAFAESAGDLHRQEAVNMELQALLALVSRAPAARTLQLGIDCQFAARGFGRRLVLAGDYSSVRRGCVGD